MTATAICGSDLHFYDGDYPLLEPVALGHEAVGTVVEAGPDVRSVKVGDLVLVSSVAGCGTCVGCATRDPIPCLSGPQIFGSGGLGGAQSDLLAVPAADFQLLRIPDGIDTEEALLLTDNLATGWAGAQRADIPPGGTVVVFGLGAVGLCAVSSAIVQGAGTVFAVDPVEGRRNRAADLGATPLAAPRARGGAGGHRWARCGIGDRRGRQRHHHDRGADLRASRRHRLGDRRARPQPVPVPGAHEPGAQCDHCG